MIRLGKYGINVSDRCYEVGKIATRTVKKTDKNTNEKIDVEEEYLANSGYYTSIESALNATYKRIAADALNNYDGDLKGAIEAIHKRTAEFEKLVRDAIPDIKGGRGNE